MEAWMAEKKEQDTREKIHTAARREFLEKGFQSASLRNIVKLAGVTTGAFYGYYKSKEELFEALTGEQAEYVLQLFDTTLDRFDRLAGEEQTRQMTDISGDAMCQLLDYIYDHSEAFKLLILCAEGTKYADFIHQLVVKETTSTFAYIETLRQMGVPVKPVNQKLIHMVSSGLFTGIFETVVHDMPKGEATEYLMQLRSFWTAGWEQLLGVKFGEK